MQEFNSIELFENNGEMINVSQLCKLINCFERETPMVYQGKGNFQRLIVTKHDGADTKAINALKLSFSDFEISEDFISLLQFSDGLSFFEYGDACIFSVDEIIELNVDASERFLEFMTYNEDAFYLKCDGSERNVYVREEGFEELRALNMSLTAFMEACLISGFSYFWLWGKENDLY